MSEEQETCDIKKLQQVNIEDYEGIEKVMRALANKTSLAILHAIQTNGEACACELEPALKLTQPLVTTHLRKLYLAGILKKRDQWRYTFYSISEHFKDLIPKIMLIAESGV